MLGLFKSHHRHLTSNHAGDQEFKDLVNTSRAPSVMCYEQQCQEGETCCHALEYGMAYCCTELSGLLYLCVMVGGGLVVALLFICCYVVMRSKEKQLEAAAQLEAAKAVSTAISSAHDAIQLAGETGAHSTDDTSAPPPAYGDVVRTLPVQRCHSHDVSVLSSSRQNNDDTASINRQLSEGSRAPTNTPSSELPPLPPCSSVYSKLPTYQQCTSTATASEFSVSNITINHQAAMYAKISSSVQRRGDRSSGNNSFKERSLGLSNNSCTEAPQAEPVPHTSEIPLSTPTQVDDGTGLVQPRQQQQQQPHLQQQQPHHHQHQQQPISEEKSSGGHSPDRVPRENSSSLRCGLQFRLNAYNQSEIAIGYKTDTNDDDDDGDDDETSPDPATDTTSEVESEENKSNSSVDVKVDE